MDTNKLKLAFLLLAVILPVGLATWYFRLAESQGVMGTTNRGQLLLPVMDISAFDLRNGAGEPSYLPFDELVAGVSPDDYKPRPWQLLYLGAPDCDEVCIERLYFLRQLHIRLGRESDRVERVYVQVADNREPLQAATAALLADAHPGMRVAYALEAHLRALLAERLPAGTDPVGAHYIFVMDPVGNIMLYFTPGNSAEDILKDLDKLLDQSSLG